MKKILFLTAALLTFVLAKAQDNNALQISDGMSYFWCNSFMEFSTSSITFEAWIKLDELDPIDDYTAVVDGRNGAKQMSKALIFKTINDILTLSYEFEGAWGFEDTDGHTEVEKGIWQHVALVVDGDIQLTTFYVNGEEKTNHGPEGAAPEEYGNIGNDISWDTLFVGGGNTDPARTIIGLIDEVRVWKVARSEEEIINNMTHEIEPNDDLLAYYRCNESPGDSTLIDISGGENHAIVRNGNDTTFTFVTLIEGEDWFEDISSVNKNKFEDISFYPNPVKDKLNFKGLEATNSEIKIFNLTGQLVENSIINNSSFDIGELNSGVYFMEIKKYDRIFRTKILKE